jgi:acetyl/propionyl-CoA carboxylase alpha subunit
MAFKRVLIANRGEIALRILRTLRDMGIEAAIIHGREDRLSLPVRLADVAYANNKANPLDTYLDIESVIAAAKEMECDAVHPGYGFLAENATFVRRLQEEGITKSRPVRLWKRLVCQLQRAHPSQSHLRLWLLNWPTKLATL